MKLGVHCSTKGGLPNAFQEAEILGINTFQIFTRNQRQWKASPVTSVEAEAYQTASNTIDPSDTFSHCSYLINLAAGDEAILEKSVTALSQEVERCTKLGLMGCVLHPGAAGTQDRNVAFGKVSAGLTSVIEANPDGNVRILLEITAGQGSSLGGKIEDLAEIVRDFPHPDRIGFCIDTCHAFAGGYDIRTVDGIEDFLGSFDKQLGLKNVFAFHLNDSKGDLGTHLDRHEHIGQGKLGLEPFRYIMQHFPDIPKVLETPKEDQMDVINLGVLRSLI